VKPGIIDYVGVSNYALASQLNMKNYYYVYSLRSSGEKSHYYVGLTKDLDARLREHNGGRCQSTANGRPWCVEVVTAFRCKDKAVAYEKYLKSHSGRAFAKRHF